MGEHLQALVDALPTLTAVLGRPESGSLGPEAYGEARALPALTAFVGALAARSRRCWWPSTTASGPTSSPSN